MPLEPQTVSIPFKAGVDEAEDKHAEPQGFLVFRDAQYLKEGGAVRRHGFREVTNYVNGSALDAVGLVTSGKDVLTRNYGDVQVGTPVLASTGPEAIDLTPYRTASPFGASVDTVEVCLVNRADGSQHVIQAVSYLDTNSRSCVRVCQYSYPDGALLSEQLIGATSGRSIVAQRLVTLDTDKFVLLYCDLNTGTGIAVLYHRRYNTLGSQMSASSDVVISSAVRTARFDACWDGATGWYTTWADSGSDNGNLTHHDAAGTSLASATITAPALNYVGLPAVCLLSSGSSDCVVVAYHSPAFLTYAQRRHVTTLALIGSEATVITSNLNCEAVAVEDVGGGVAAVVVWDSNVTDPTVDETGPNLTKFAYVNDVGTVSGETFIGNTVLVVAPFYIPTWSGGHRWYIGVKHGHADGGYPTVTLLGIDTLATRERPVARLSFDEAGIVGSLSTNRIPRAPVVSTYRRLLVGPTNLTNTVNRTRAAVLNFRPTSLARTELNGLAFMGGALPAYTNGDIVREAAFLFEPEPPSLALGAAGNITGNPTHYCLVWEFIDSRGNTFISPPSDGASIVTTADQVDVSFRTRPYSGNSDTLVGTVPRVRVKIYRTDAATGEVFQLVTTLDVVSSDGDYTTYTDNITESALGEVLTADDVTALASGPIPPLSHVWTHRNRVFGIRADDPRQVVYSTEATPPDAPRWNAVLSLAVDAAGGTLTAGASMDDKLVLFQEDSILVTSGLGPDGTGANGSFGIPERLPSAVGVSFANRNSVVTTPAGIMFRHSCGIYLLGRDLSVNDIGQSIKDTLGTKTVRRAAVMPSLHQVWWVLEGSTDVLVYDYRYGRWAVYTAPAIAVDAIEVAGIAYLLTEQPTPGGHIVFKYDPTTYADLVAATQVWVTPSIETPWIRGAKKGGMQRCWKVYVDGRWQGPGALVVQVYTQTDDRFTKATETADQTYTFASADLAASAAGEPWSRNLRPRVQRCSAVKVRVSLADPAGGADKNTQGSVFTGLRLDLGIATAAGKTPKRPAIT